MPKQYVAPTIEERENDVHCDSIERHPSYGQISANRTSGQAQLYGSDFLHQHYITIRLKTSELHRNLSNDNPFARGKDLMEVAMTESQWATMVSSLNTGQGVQCTIEYINGAEVPGIHRPVNRKSQFEKELDDRLKDTEDRLKGINKLVQDLPCSQKKKDEILHELKVSLHNLSPNLQFTRDQFGEYMEDQTQRAKMEINAYAQHMLEKYAQPGATALNAAPTSPVRMLEGENPVDGEVIKGE